LPGNFGKFRYMVKRGVVGVGLPFPK